MKKALSFLIALLLVILAGTVPALAEKNAELAAVFERGGTLRLVPAELPGVAEAGGEPVGISPDGKTVLLRGGREFGLLRDGQARLLTFNAQRGAGDIYGKEKMVRLVMTRMPSVEGLSWSSDGRYMAVSSLISSLQEGRAVDAMVLDASSGEVYLADTVGQKLRDSGSVYLTRVDRSGTYLYYLLYNRENGEPRQQFCRCPVEGGEREVLHDTAYDETAPYDVVTGSALFEAADGSWVLSGTREAYRSKEKRNQMQLALIRFTPSGGEWKQEIFSFGIPAGPFGYALSGWSAVSGYGAFCVGSSMAQSSAQMTPAQQLIYSVAQHVNFVRVLPGETPSCDVWYLRKTGEGAGDVEFRPAGDFLWSFKVNYGMLHESETAEAEQWTAASLEAEGLYLPKDYGPEEFAEELRRGSRLLVLGACLSPDGYYALINAGIAGSFRLYLVDLETMKILPVEAPEGVGGTAVSATPLGRSFAPGFVWNEDGTLLINGDGGVRALRLEINP